METKNDMGVLPIIPYRFLPCSETPRTHEGGEGPLFGMADFQQQNSPLF